MRIPLPRRLVQSKFCHKLLQGLAFRFSSLAAIAACHYLLYTFGGLALAAVAVPDRYQDFAWWYLAVVAVLAVITAVSVYRKMADKEVVRRNVIDKHLARMHRDVFQSNSGFRLTFFIIDPSALSYEARGRFQEGKKSLQCMLIPYRRKRFGRQDCGLWDSNLYYPLESTAVTALALKRSPREARQHIKNAASENLELQPSLQEFPDFRKQPGDARSNLDHYYQATLGIDPRIVARVSDRMIDVRQILSYPLTDHDDRPMGLLSVDAKDPFVWSDVDVAELSDRVSVEIDQVKLFESLEDFRRDLIRVWPRRGEVLDYELS